MHDSFTVEKAALNTAFGSFDFYCFSWGQHEEDNILCEMRCPVGDSALVRIQSACYTAEIFRSTDCDCHAQLASSLRRIGSEGGLLIYMLCDGRGAGLLNKVRGLALGEQAGMDTADAYSAMGIELDPRDYTRAGVILRHFGINRVRLLTNNPRKLDGLARQGITVSREPLEIPSTENSRGYLRTKALKMGHFLSEFRGPISF